MVRGNAFARAGEVTFYAPDVMERVYHRRLELAQVPYCDKPACVGYIATLRPGDLGRKVWLAVAGQAARGTVSGRGLRFDT